MTTLFIHRLSLARHIFDSCTFYNTYSSLFISTFSTYASISLSLLSVSRHIHQPWTPTPRAQYSSGKSVVSAKESLSAKAGAAPTEFEQPWIEKYRPRVLNDVVSDPTFLKLSRIAGD